MAMNYYDQTMPQGAQIYDSTPSPYYGGGGDTNPAGAADDPFAYTKGSLLTPWEGRFNSSGYGGGASAVHYQAPAYSQFDYKDFDYKAPDVGQFGEVYNNPAAFGETYTDPAAFRFADFAGPSDFKAPTAEDMRNDPGYQARMDAVKNAQVAGAAHGGVLRSGGFQKGLAQAVGNQASQEYQNVYNRAASEHDRLRSEGVSNYGINQGNTKSAFDTNTANRLTGYTTRRGGYESDVANQLAGYKTRQGAWQGNADTALKQGELGYNIASGAWDRNEGKARQVWQDTATHNQQLADAANQSAASAASASASNANFNYQRDLGDYTRARDEFYTNQDRQYGILSSEANRGLQATNQYGNQMMGGYNNMADYAMGGANAQASGTMGQGNAWGGFAGNVGNTISGMAMYGGLYGGQQPMANVPYR